MMNLQESESASSPKLCPKVIIEGARLTLKTEIAFELSENSHFVGQRKYRYHSPIISAEWTAFTDFPGGRGLINFEPHEEERALETYHIWERLFELLRYYSWIVDRFHLSTRMYQMRTYGRDYDFSWLEKSLCSLGFHLVFCTRDAPSFEEIKRLRSIKSGGPEQYYQLETFLDEQSFMKRLVAESALPLLELDVSDNDAKRAAGKIVEWMDRTGGLRTP
ncbi:MAG: hypothetical protein RDV48_26955 [Candidatus Eremiobacteraeota bacterium]|nr:hypothetical protein [Candidatus Eremiobacteraeota bacterium]